MTHWVTRRCNLIERDIDSIDCVEGMRDYDILRKPDSIQGTVYTLAQCTHDPLCLGSVCETVSLYIVRTSFTPSLLALQP